MARSRSVSRENQNSTSCATCQVPGGRLRTSTNHRRQHPRSGETTRCQQLKPTATTNTRVLYTAPHYTHSAHTKYMGNLCHSLNIPPTMTIAFLSIFHPGITNLHHAHVCTLLCWQSAQSLGEIHRDTHINTHEVALKVGDSFTRKKTYDVSSSVCKQ